MALKYVMIATTGKNEVVEEEFPKTDAGETAWGEAIKKYWQKQVSQI